MDSCEDLFSFFTVKLFAKILETLHALPQAIKIRFIFSPSITLVSIGIQQIYSTNASRTLNISIAFLVLIVWTSSWFRHLI